MNNLDAIKNARTAEELNQLCQTAGFKLKDECLWGIADANHACGHACFDLRRFPL